MELREALTQIGEIRRQMARGEVFRGYRAATTGFSGVLAVVTGVLQWVLLADAAARPKAYVLLWAAAAGVCLVAVGVEMVVRTRRSASVVQRQLTLLAVEQFVPSVAAGGLLTWVFYDFMPGEIWMLPGLWMVMFSLGMFASCRLMPREMFGVAGFYLIAGVLVLLEMQSGGGNGGGWRYSPWVMAGVFGVGQMGTAGVLYWKLERVNVLRH